MKFDDRPRRRPLGDTVARDYARKLQLFNAFAEPELRLAMRHLRLRSGQRVLDAGCGTGEALAWLARETGGDGLAIGVDLSIPHLRACHGSEAVQADLAQLPFGAGSLDAIWCVNTIHHVDDPLATLRDMLALLRDGGRIALGQTSFLPDMYFAWDARLERLVNEAVRSHYRDRYRLDERSLANVRSLVGMMRTAGLVDVEAHTIAIDRTSPVDMATEAYLQEAIFRNTWGEKVRPYLSAEDYAELELLCNPASAHYAPRRDDFHFIQTFTLVTGSHSD